MSMKQSAHRASTGEAASLVRERSNGTRSRRPRYSSLAANTSRTSNESSAIIPRRSQENASQEDAVKNWTALALLCFSAIACCQDASSVALLRIQSTAVFAFGGVGFAGRTSQGEIDFKTIVSLPREQAIASFEQLFEKVDPQAKSYALAGLRKLDVSRFETLRMSLQNSPVKVQIMRGCILSRESLQQVASGIESGQYDSGLR
jgi:hypothetical protein